MNKQSLLRLTLVCALAANLSACVEMVVGSAVVSGLAVSDRRTLGAQTEDKTIGVKGELRVSQLVGSAGHVNLASFNRHVLLTGEVRDEAMRAAVEKEVRAIEGVQNVSNELDIAPVSSASTRASDAVITTKIKAGLFNDKELYANSVKVVTERGVVWLMGRVTQREGDKAAEIARTVSGVQKVMKMFDYMTEEELKKILPAQTEPATATN